MPLNQPAAFAMSRLTLTTRTTYRLLGAATLFFLAGCSWTETRPSGNSTTISSNGQSFDDSGIPDVIPKLEPQTGAGNPKKYKVFGKNYRVMSTAEARGYKKRGKASWYGEKFHGRKTSNGETYNMYDVTAAHKSLRIPCYVRVTHLNNGRSIIVRVNDRGPFVGDRIIDLSFGAATKLGMVREGVADVEIALIDPSDYATAVPQIQAVASSTTIDYAKIPTATTYPVDIQTAPAQATERFIGVPAVPAAVIGDISTLPQSRPVQPATGSTTNDASQYIQAATPQPGNGYGDVQYHVTPDGDLVAEDFTEVYIEENQIADYERLNPASEETLPIEIPAEVTEVAFSGSRDTSTSPVEAAPLPQPVDVAVAPPQQTPASSATAAYNITQADDGGLPFYVQVATFQNNDNAINLAEKLSGQQFTPVRLVAGEFGGKILQQVRVGPYSSAQQAKSQQAVLANAGYPRCFVVRSRH